MENIIGKKNWVLFGLLWGTFMFLALSIVFPLLDGSQLNVLHLIKSLVIWLIMGLAFGYTMKLFEQRKG